MGPVFSKGFCCVLIFSWSEYYTSSDSGGEGKSKQAEKYGTKKSKERREEPLGTTSYQTSSKRSRFSRRSLLFFVPCFSACLDFSSPLLSAPGSPRMNTITTIQQISISLFYLNEYSRTSLFRTRLIRSPRYFEGRSNALGFTLPLYASPVISKPRYFELFFISLGTSKWRGSTVVLLSPIRCDIISCHFRTFQCNSGYNFNY